MSADERARNGLEMASLTAFRRLGPREQRAILDLLIRRLDGQPLDACFTEFGIACGDTPEAARKKAGWVIENAALGGDDTRSWREILN